jgi:SanA protein
MTGKNSFEGDDRSILSLCVSASLCLCVNLFTFHIFFRCEPSDRDMQLETKLLEKSAPPTTKSKKRRQKGCLAVVALLVVLALSPILWRNLVKVYYNGRIYPPETVPAKPVAIVFGAAVYGNDRLSAILRDRMDTAIDLYLAGQVNKIIVSGDNSSIYYDEPGTMMAYAIEHGVAAEDVQPDYAGLRTYDTCYRARDIFGVQEAVLVTQAFHLPRALLTCRGLGLDAVGVAADRRPLRYGRWYEIRETAAMLVAVWDVVRRQPPPVMDEPIPVELN